MKVVTAATPAIGSLPSHKPSLIDGFESTRNPTTWSRGGGLLEGFFRHLSVEAGG